MAVFIGGLAYANPSFFLTRISTSGDTATTTVSYLSNAETATLTYDTWKNPQDSTTITNNLVDSLSLAVQFHATSTAEQISWKYEYSNDNIDWYPESFAQGNSGYNATTTNQTLGTGQRFTWKLASSTSFTVANGIRGHRIVDVPVITRYVRVIFTFTGTHDG